MKIIGNDKAEVLSVNMSKNKGTKKINMGSGEFIEDYGMRGDAHAGNSHRQVSLLAKESIDKMKESGVSSIQYGDFAENITTKGIELHKLNVGTKLLINEVVLEVSQIGKKCHQKCEIFREVGKCIMPTEGVFAKIISGGMVEVGDEIKKI